MNFTMKTKENSKPPSRKRKREDGYLGTQINTKVKEIRLLTL